MHVEAELGDAGEADFVLALLLLEQAAELADVLVVLLAEDLAVLGVADLGDGVVGGFAQDLAGFEPALRAGDHLHAARKLSPWRVLNTPRFRMTPWRTT